MAKEFVVIYMFISALLVQSSAFGDLVYLNNGRHVEGEIIEETDKAVTLKIKIGQIVLRKDEIKTVEKKKLPSDFFGDTAGSGAFKEGPQVTGRPETKDFLLNIKAEHIRLSSGDAIVVETTTDLPPNTVLWFVLKNATQTIEMRKEVIKKSPFSVQLGRFDPKKILPGPYVVEAIFSPDEQEDEGIKEKVKGSKAIRAESEMTIGTTVEAENVAAKCKSELISQIEEAVRMYDEMTGEYETQKKTFNKTNWKASILKWKAKIKDVKSSVVNYRAARTSFDLVPQEDNLNEVAYSLEMLMNRYADELFKVNNLTYNLSSWAASKDIETLDKEIKERLTVLNSFVKKSEKIGTGE